MIKELDIQHIPQLFNYSLLHHPPFSCLIMLSPYMFRFCIKILFQLFIVTASAIDTKFLSYSDTEFFACMVTQGHSTTSTQWNVYTNIKVKDAALKKINATDIWLDFFRPGIHGKIMSWISLWEHRFLYISNSCPSRDKSMQKGWWRVVSPLVLGNNLKQEVLYIASSKEGHIHVASGKQ